MRLWPRNPTFAFGLRSCLVLAVLLAPLPWLADTYTTVFGTLSNGALFLADHDSRVGFRLEPPDSIRRQGSWMGVLRVEDRQARRIAKMSLDVRSFSYRPIATFLALAVAARLKGRRKNAVVFGGGLAAMVVITSAVTLVAALRFGIGRVVGFGDGAVNETLYEALTTPAMTYVIPLLCFCLFLRLARDRRPNEPSMQGPEAKAAAT